MKHIAKLIILVSVLLFSCGEDHNFTPALKPIDNSATSYVKFVHAASDTTGVNFFIGDTKITGNAPTTVAGTTLVNIGTVTYSNAYPVTDYTTINPVSGTTKIVVPEVYTANTTYVTKTLSTGNISAAAGASYTVAFVGFTKNYETVVLTDDLTTAPADGKAYIRFANFIQNAPALSLRATPPNNADGTTNPPVILVSNMAYKSASGFIALPLTGTYTNVQIINTATTPATVVATLAANLSSFANNKVYTVFARGHIGVTGARAPGGSRMIHR